MVGHHDHRSEGLSVHVANCFLGGGEVAMAVAWQLLEVGRMYEGDGTGGGVVCHMMMGVPLLGASGHGC